MNRPKKDHPWRRANFASKPRCKHCNEPLIHIKSKRQDKDLKTIYTGICPTCGRVESKPIGRSK